jgi:hypothetical protein
LRELDVRSIVLQRVAEVGQEPQAVFELDLVRLIVYGRPGASDVLLLSLGAALAEAGLDLELVHELDLPEVLLREAELVVLVDDLELIGDLVRAHFCGLVEVHLLRLAADIEVP